MQARIRVEHELNEAKMSTGELRRGIFWRMCSWGVVAGLGFGTAYGTILFSLTGMILGCITGGILGLLLGIVTGFYLSLISIEVYHPLRDAKRYLRAATVECTVISVIGASVVFGFLSLVQLNLSRPIWSDDVNLAILLPCFAAPTLMAGAATTWATRRAAQWYIFYADVARPAPNPSLDGAYDWEKKG